MISGDYSLSPDVRSMPQRPSCFKKMGFALLVIAFIGSLVAIGWGGAGLGGATSLTHSYSIILLTFGATLGGIALIIVIIWRRHSKQPSVRPEENVSVTVPASDPPPIASPPAKPQVQVRETHSISNENQDPIREKIRKGLDLWICAGRAFANTDAYRNQLAKEAILRCFDQKEEFLDLSHTRIETLPSEIKYLTHLKELKLNDNNLRTLPSEIGQLIHLEHLDLSSNSIESLPQELAPLVNLKTIDLGGNNLSSLPEVITRLTNLKSLGLDQNSISSLPPEIRQLTLLERLSLFSNSIESLPQELALLVNLKTIDLAGNNLSSLPEVITRLTNLEILSLIQNRFSSLPSEIKRLTHLKALYLTQNRFRTLPPEICHLSRIERLDLTYNSIESLPEELTQLANLRVLDLMYNNLSSFPNVIISLTNLKNLWLDGNRISSLPPEISNLIHLELLYLNRNALASLPDQILEMPPNLKISIERNPISERTLNSLRSIIHANGYAGPTIYYSVNEGNTGNEHKSLDTLLSELSKAAEQSPLQLTNFAEIREKLRSWLAKLSTIGDYKNKRKELALKIYKAIEKADQELDFRDTFLSCIDEAETTCGDRMAMSLLYLDINFQIAECAKRKDLKELAYLIGHGSWALSELSQIAENKVCTLRIVDPIEVYLAYPIKLKEELKLPIILDTMLYYACSDVTQADLADATKPIKEKLSNLDAYADILIENSTWLECLESQREEEYKKIIQQYETAGEALSEDSDIKEFARVEQERQNNLKNLTKTVLKDVGLPPFCQ
jgi:Leucine-rich repeat (LRR) protein